MTKPDAPTPPDVEARIAAIGAEANEAGFSGGVWRRECVAALRREAALQQQLQETKDCGQRVDDQLAALQADRDALREVISEAANRSRQIDPDEYGCFDGWNADEAYLAGQVDGERGLALLLRTRLAPSGPRPEGEG